MIEPRRIDNAAPRRLPFNVRLPSESFHNSQEVEEAVSAPATVYARGEESPWR